MAKAVEAQLGDLHGAIAQVMTQQVLMKEDVTEIDEDGQVNVTGEQVFNATPALLAVAAKFLKDNSITADVSVDTNMGALKAALDKKQLSSRRGLPDASAAAQADVH